MRRFLILVSVLLAMPIAHASLGPAKVPTVLDTLRGLLVDPGQASGQRLVNARAYFAGLNGTEQKTIGEADPQLFAALAEVDFAPAARKFCQSKLEIHLIVNENAGKGLMSDSARKGYVTKCINDMLNID